MKRLFSVILVFLMFFSGIPAGMAGTAQSVQATSSVSVSVTAVSNGPNGGAAVIGDPSSPTPGGSNAPTISQEQAMAVAQGIFPDIRSKNVDAQLNAYQTPARWRLSWSEPADRSGPAVRMNMNNIEIDAVTGALDGFHISDWKAVKIGSPLITRDEALQRAEDFIKKHHPEEFAHVAPSNTPKTIFSPYKMVSFTYNFNWDRVEQGVPVLGDGIQVGVDPFSGRIVNYSFNWHTGVTFPDPVAVDKAGKARFMDQFGVILCYQLKPGQLNPQGAPEASLVYQFNCSPGLQIDPVSGNALTSEGKTAPLQDFVMIPGLAPAVPGAVYGKEPVVLPAREITRDVAQANAERFFKTLGLEGKAVSSGSGSSSWDGIFYDKIWYYNLENEEASQGRFRGMEPYSVGIDAATGEIRSYFHFPDATAPGTGSPKPTLTRDKARDKALAFIKQVSPDKAGQIVATNQPDFYTGNAQEVSVYFTRLVGGIPLLQDGISMTLDQSGEVVMYNCNWRQVALAPVSGIITAEQAKQLLLQNLPLKAEYVFPVSLPKGSPAGQDNGTVSANPMFALRYQGGGVAADTGKPVELGFGILGIGPGTGQPTVSVPQGHWAAASLTILADSGLLPASDFNPDSPVTVRDALRVLMGSFGSMITGQRRTDQSAFNDVAPNDPDYAIIQAAVDRGVLDPGVEPGSFLYPDAPLAREAFVRWLVRAMGYREVAEMQANIDLDFSDVQQLTGPDRNYAAIAEGLGIVRGDDRGTFRPGASLTWAELATMVAKAAPRLQTL